MDPNVRFSDHNGFTVSTCDRFAGSSDLGYLVVESGSFADRTPGLLDVGQRLVWDASRKDKGAGRTALNAIQDLYGLRGDGNTVVLALLCEARRLGPDAGL